MYIFLLFLLSMQLCTYFYNICTQYAHIYIIFVYSYITSMQVSKDMYKKNNNIIMVVDKI